MRTYRERKIVPYSPDQVFDVVGDVEHYPEFLPWVEDLVIHKRWEEDGVEHFEATMTVTAKSYSGAARTQVRLDHVENEIVVDLLDGPFKHLHNTWKFRERKQRGTEVFFYIEFEFTSRVYQTLIGAFMGEAARRMVGAFTDRMKKLYG